MPTLKKRLDDWNEMIGKKFLSLRGEMYSQLTLKANQSSLDAHGLQQVTDINNITTNNVRTNGGTFIGEGNETPFVKIGSNNVGSGAYSKQILLHNPTEFSKWTNTETGYVHYISIPLGGETVTPIDFEVELNRGVSHIDWRRYITIKVSYYQNNNEARILINDPLNKAPNLEIKHFLDTTNDRLVFFFGNTADTMSYHTLRVTKARVGYKSRIKGWDSGITTDYLGITDPLSSPSQLDYEINTAYVDDNFALDDNVIHTTGDESKVGRLDLLATTNGGSDEVLRLGRNTAAYGYSSFFQKYDNEFYPNGKTLDININLNNRYLSLANTNNTDEGKIVAHKPIEYDGITSDNWNESYNRKRAVHNYQYNSDFIINDLSDWHGSYGVQTISGGIYNKTYNQASSAARLQWTNSNLEIGEQYTLTLRYRSNREHHFQSFINATEDLEFNETWVDGEWTLANVTFTVTGVTVTFRFYVVGTSAINDYIDVDWITITKGKEGQIDKILDRDYFVNTYGDQTNILGNKTFNGNLAINGGIYQDNGDYILRTDGSNFFAVTRNGLVDGSSPYTDMVVDSSKTRLRSTGDLAIFTRPLSGNLSEIARFTTDGKLGIGTLTPQTELDVNGVITATGGNSSQWNDAYSWGDHYNLYIRKGATANNPLPNNVIDLNTPPLGTYLSYTRSDSSNTPLSVGGFLTQHYFSSAGVDYTSQDWTSISGNRFFRRSNVNESFVELYHTGNDGTGSGLDADLLDGQQGSYYLDYNNFTNLPDLSALNEISQHADFASFPATGTTDVVYIANDTGYMYRWNGSGYSQLTDQTAIWGQISGTLSNQTDLQNALNAKEDAFSKNTAFNKNFGTASGTVAEGNHNHNISNLTDDLGLVHSKGSIPDATDFDTILENGIYQTTSASSGMVNCPVGSSPGIGNLIVMRSSGYVTQKYVSRRSSATWERSANSSDVFTAWRRTWSDADFDITDYAFTAGTGLNLTGTEFSFDTAWGNDKYLPFDASATNFITNVSIDADLLKNTFTYLNASSANVPNEQNGFYVLSGGKIDFSSNGYKAQLFLGTNDDAMYYRSDNGGTGTYGTMYHMASREWVNAQGYLTSETDPTVPSHVKAITSQEIMDWKTAFDKKVNAVSVTGTNTKTLTVTREDGTTITTQWTDLDSPPDGDEYIDQLSFNSGNGVLSAGRTGGLPDVTTSLDGRYSLLGHTHPDPTLNDVLVAGSTIIGVHTIEGSLNLENETTNWIGRFRNDFPGLMYLGVIDKNTSESAQWGINSGGLYLHSMGDEIATLDTSLLSATRNYQFPNASGTLALVSQIPSLSGYALSRNITVNSGSGTLYFAPEYTTNVFTTSTASIGIRFMAASTHKHEIYIIVAHTSKYLQNELGAALNYINSAGNTTNVIRGAVHLQSDGTNWYQVNTERNNISKSSTFSGISLSPRPNSINVYNGDNEEGTLSFPDPSADEWIDVEFTLINRGNMHYMQNFKDSTGTTVTEYTPTEGEVMKFWSDGADWVKIN